jgi:hypothetical protein
MPGSSNVMSGHCAGAAAPTQSATAAAIIDGGKRPKRREQHIVIAHLVIYPPAGTPRV